MGNCVATSQRYGVSTDWETNKLTYSRMISWPHIQIRKHIHRPQFYSSSKLNIKNCRIGYVPDCAGVFSCGGMLGSNRPSLISESPFTAGYPAPCWYGPCVSKVFPLNVGKYIADIILSQYHPIPISRNKSAPIGKPSESVHARFPTITGR